MLVNELADGQSLKTNVSLSVIVHDFKLLSDLPVDMVSVSGKGNVKVFATIDDVTEKTDVYEIKGGMSELAEKLYFKTGNLSLEEFKYKTVYFEVFCWGNTVGRLHTQLSNIVTT